MTTRSLSKPGAPTSRARGGTEPGVGAILARGEQPWLAIRRTQLHNWRGSYKVAT